MKKFNKTLAIAFFAAVSAFSFQSVSAAPTIVMDDSNDPIYMGSEENDEASFAKNIGPQWSSVDKLIEDNPMRETIVMIGTSMYEKRKAGTLIDASRDFYVVALEALDTPELVIYLLLTAS